MISFLVQLDYGRGLLLLAVVGILACGNGMQQDPKTDQVNGEARTAAEKEVFDDQSGVREVKIYYRHPQLQGLIGQPRTIFESDREINHIKQVIDHLTIAPGDLYGEPIWPSNTYVREVYTLGDGTLAIDFNSSFTETLQVSVLEEDFMVYSLVQSLLENFTDFDKVHILIDGHVQETFLGHVDIEFPLGLRRNPLTIVPDPIEEIIVEDLGEPGSQ